jgi:valyl-tRNA synthetase
VPDGYTAKQRGVPGGFSGDPDVMDTWATSSLSPQIVSGWPDDPDLFSRIFPMDVRPQAHDIIRTWLFSTVLRAHLEHGVLPWANAAISGWVLDPDRKKMSKSKGNVVTPMALLDEHGSDGVRYWAASGRPGVDTAFDAGQMRVGRRLSIKLLNAAKFVLARPGDLSSGAVSAPLDRAVLERLADLVDGATRDFEAYDYARVLERTESFFWFFCDNYLELVKSRRYGDHGEALAASANTAMLASLSTVLRLFAPFLPFVTEEVWSWWQEGSIHRSRWPEAADLRGLVTTDAESSARDRAALDMAVQVLGEIRRTKSEGKKPLKTPAARVRVVAPAASLERLSEIEIDLRAAGLIGQLETAEGDFRVDVELGEIAQGTPS